MFKILAIIISVAMLLSCTGCGNQANGMLIGQNRDTVTTTQSSVSIFENSANDTTQVVSTTTENTTTTTTTTANDTTATSVNSTTSTTQTTTTTAATTTTTTTATQNTTKKTTTTKETAAKTTTTVTTTSVAKKHQYSELELEIFRLLNVERKNAGVEPLTLNDEYHICAETRAKEISVSWGHTRPNGKRYNTVFGDFGFYPRNYQSAENIGMGFGDAKSITKALMNSEPHRRNMLSPKATEVVIAVFVDSNGKIHLDEIFLAKIQ